MMRTVGAVIEVRDHDALAHGTDTAWGGCAVPDLVGTDEGRATIRIDMLDAGLPDRCHAGHRGDLRGFACGQLDRDAVHQDAVLVGRLDRSAELLPDRRSEAHTSELQSLLRIS